MSNHASKLTQIVNSYGLTPQLITALELYCKTLEENAARHAKRLQAEDVCENLHAPPASGLKCLKCYMAEQHFAQEDVVAAEMEAIRAQGGQSNED